MSKLPRNTVDGNLALLLSLNDVATKLAFDFGQFPIGPSLHVDQFGIPAADSLVHVVASVLEGVEEGCRKEEVAFVASGDQRPTGKVIGFLALTCSLHRKRDHVVAIRRLHSAVETRAPGAEIEQPRHPRGDFLALTL